MLTTTERSPIHELAIGHMATQIVYAAAELGIADLLAAGPLSSAELAERADAHTPSMRRLLPALAALGIVAQIEPDRFELTDRGRRLQEDAPDSERALVRMLCGPDMWLSWNELVPSVRTGERPWERANGMPVFEFYGRNPERAATFGAAMAQHTRDAAPAIVAAVDFSRFRTVMDLGGGEGALMAEILRVHPDIEGVVFDLPEALPSEAAWRVVPGDFFAAVPEGADAYVLKQVLHDWDDERALTILRNCRAAMGPGARVLILDRILEEPVTAGDPYVSLLDMLMLVVTGGRERTEREFRELVAAAGLMLVDIGEPIPPFHYRLIEATKE
jgi:hypothetical protein